MCCAGDPGGTIQPMRAYQAANITTRGFAMSPMDSAWRARYKPAKPTTLTRRIVLLSLLQFAPAIALAGKTPAPKDAYLYIIWPTDGEQIRGAFWCRFGLRNMGVTHAG